MARIHVFLLVAFLLNCFNVSAQVPVASFSASATNACAPANIQFTNTSQNAVSFYWVFGNGNSSVLASPANIFSSPGTYTVTLTVQSASGQSSVTSAQIIVAPPPVASFTASTTVTCQANGIVSFQNNSTGYDSCVWDFGDGTTSNLNHPSHVYALGGTFNSKLIVYNRQLGCSDMQIQNALIRVNPTPSGTISVDSAETCNPNRVFNFTSTITGAPTSWLWRFGDGTTSGAISSVTKTYTNPGNYVVSLILLNSFGCSDTVLLSDTIKVKSNPMPILTRSDSIGCEPLNVYYGCNPVAGATYLWNFGNGTNSALRNPGLVYQTAGSYNPVFTINYANGCSRTLNMTPTIVSSSPQVSYTMTNHSGCVPLTVNFTNTTPGVNTYKWLFGDGDSSYAVNPIHTYSVPGIHVATLTAYSANGCSRTYRNNWYFVNASGPIVDFQPDITSGCSPLTVNFSNKTSGTNTYLWNFGDGDTSTLQHPTHIYTANGNYTVTLVATNALGCSKTFIYPIQINVSSLMVSSVAPAPINVCAPYTVYFSDNTAASAWLWDFGDGTTSTQKNPLHTFTSPGIYNVNLTIWMANGGCSYTIPTIQQIIVSSIKPGFTWTVSQCPPYAVSFTDTTSGAVSWHWNFGDGTTSNLQHPVHSYTTPGSYTVSLTVTSANGCSATYSATGGVTFTGLGARPALICTDSIPPFNVQFYANSTNANSWTWDFGDGTTSTLQNPSHLYTTGGTFTISLTIANDSCSYTYSYPPQSVGSASGSGGGFGNPPPSVYRRTVQCAPYTVNFYNPYLTASTVLWDFGDGTTSTQFNPTKTYSDTGAFTPTLIYSVNGIFDTLIYSDTFFVAKAPTDFILSYANTCNSINVNVSTIFSGLSNVWSFGSGSFVTGPTAAFTYPNTNGNHVIRLNTTDANGCKATIAKSFSVNLSSPISVSKRRGCAGDTINFSAGNLSFVSYLWDFGDNTFSTLRDPYHVYADSGVFQANLAATDLNGCVTIFSFSSAIQIYDPVANFSILQPHGNCDWVFTRVYNSSRGATSYLWDFGDGSYSTDFNMFHYYSQPGYHDITLVASNNVCSSTMVLSDAVYVANLTPSFTYTSTGDCLPSTIQFINTSIDAVSWHWNFGDGDTSMLENPSHIYTRPPTGPVVLTVTDINGCVKSIIDTVINPTAADFSIDISGGCSPLIVSFSDTSYNGVSWNWDFGDGSFSNQINPVHTYANDGLYTVTLSVTGPNGCVSQKILNPGINVMTPTAAFNVDSLNGCAPMMVSFTNESTGSTIWHWDFGDGAVSSIENPQHLYALPGKYSVTLIASNAYGCADTISIIDYIVTRGSYPDFTITQLTGCSPLSVQFSDQSVGAASWQWYFGDGTIQSGQNPIHVYTGSGSFTPSLYTTDSTGCTSSFTFSQPILLNATPVAFSTDMNFTGCAPVIVNYSSVGSSADSVVYFMGDGSNYANSSVVHTYSRQGIYHPYLVAYNVNGCTDTMDLTPVGVFDRPQISFTASDTIGCFPVAVSFSNTSAGLNQASFNWDFGNGLTDTAANPNVVFQNPGIYDIKLVVTNQGGCIDSIIKSAYINVYDHQPPVKITWQGVSVLSDHSVQLDFINSVEPDVDYYAVYRLNSTTGVFDSIATLKMNQVKKQVNVSLIDSLAHPGFGPFGYKVQAVDICGYRIDKDSLDIQTTVFLQPVAGFMKVDLQWTAYEGKTPAQYQVLRSKDGVAYSKISAVSNTTFNYTDTTAYCPTEYAYKIVAVDLNSSTYKSSSNEVKAFPSSDIGSLEVKMKRTTVVENNFTLTEWLAPLRYPWLVERYHIWRSDDNVNFKLIADVPSLVHEYEDHTADFQKHEYYYKVTAYTECGTSESSEPSSSIWLQVHDFDLKSILKWTPYKDWDNGVDSYRIEKLNSSGIWEELRTVPGNVIQVAED